MLCVRLAAAQKRLDLQKTPSSMMRLNAGATAPTEHGIKCGFAQSTEDANRPPS